MITATGVQPYHESPGTTLYVGDCRDVLATMDPVSVDACVCDPPYDLTGKSRNGSPRQNDPATPFGRHRLQSTGGFMGHRWDATGVAFDPATWEAVYRVLKPGAYLVAFGGTRTWHRMATAIEDAGFEIKDCLCWLYGSGMPKHKSLLKPAWEPIVLAKKRGQGSINRDACRIGTTDTLNGGAYSGELRRRDEYTTTDNAPGAVMLSRLNRGAGEYVQPSGRVPANVILDDVAAAMLDEQTGNLHPGNFPRVRNGNGMFSGDGGGMNGAPSEHRRMDGGGASRFFYCSKADDTERHRGLPVGMVNDHPTVKPVSLVQWLVRLVASPGQTVVDPFCGSGTTGIGCSRERVIFRGIDLSEHYAEISKYRIVGDAPLFASLLTA